MKSISYLIAIAAFFAVAASCHSNNSKDKDTANAQRHSFAFIKNTTINGLCEIKASGLAITNSNNHRVIDLAKLIIDEQTAIDSGLDKLKTTYHITVKDTIDSFDAHWIDSLSKQNGPKFDKSYVAKMTGIHRADSLLYIIIARASSVGVSQFAQKNFPSVKRRLDSAIAISKSIK